MIARVSYRCNPLCVTPAHRGVPRSQSHVSDQIASDTPSLSPTRVRRICTESSTVDSAPLDEYSLTVPFSFIQTVSFSIRSVNSRSSTATETVLRLYLPRPSTLLVYGQPIPRRMPRMSTSFVPASHSVPSSPSIRQSATS